MVGLLRRTRGFDSDTICDECSVYDPSDCGRRARGLTRRITCYACAGRVGGAERSWGDIDVELLGAPLTPLWMLPRESNERLDDGAR